MVGTRSGLAGLGSRLCEDLWLLVDGLGCLSRDDLWSLVGELDSWLGEDLGALVDGLGWFDWFPFDPSCGAAEAAEI